MVTQEEAERAVQYLVDSAIPYAEAKAGRQKAEHMLKHYKALYTAQSEAPSHAAKENAALARTDYKERLEEYGEYCFREQKILGLRQAAEIKVSFFQTIMKLQRGT